MVQWQPFLARARAALHDVAPPSLAAANPAVRGGPVRAPVRCRRQTCAAVFRRWVHGRRRAGGLLRRDPSRRRCSSSSLQIGRQVALILLLHAPALLAIDSRGRLIGCLLLRPEPFLLSQRLLFRRDRGRTSTPGLKLLLFANAAAREQRRESAAQLLCTPVRVLLAQPSAAPTVPARPCR